MRRVLLLMLTVTACTPGRGAPCDDGAPCGDDYVCTTITGTSLRRCLLPCARDTQNACGVGVVVPGLLCADGSVCTDSDQGPVCYFAGRIAIGATCPDPACDPTVGACACEPGTHCYGGVCRQVCDALPRCPDTPGVNDAGPQNRCAVGETCTDGLCIP